MLDRRITVQQIATQIGVSRTLVSLILKGERKGYAHRPKIAKALGLSEKKLFNGEKKGRVAL